MAYPSSQQVYILRIIPRHENHLDDSPRFFPKHWPLLTSLRYGWKVVMSPEMFSLGWTFKNIRVSLLFCRCVPQPNVRLLCYYGFMNVDSPHDHITGVEKLKWRFIQNCSFLKTKISTLFSLELLTPMKIHGSFFYFMGLSSLTNCRKRSLEL